MCNGHGVEIPGIKGVREGKGGIWISCVRAMRSRRKQAGGHCIERARDAFNFYWGDRSRVRASDLCLI